MRSSRESWWRAVPSLTMVPPQLVVDYYFFSGARRVEVREKGSRAEGDKKGHVRRKHSPRTRLQKKTNNAQSEVHARFDAQRVVHQRQGLEPSHEPPRVAAVVAHGEELPPADVTEEALQSQVAVCGQGEAVDGVGGEERVLKRGGGGRGPRKERRVSEREENEGGEERGLPAQPAASQRKLCSVPSLFFFFCSPVQLFNFSLFSA